MATEVLLRDGTRALTWSLLPDDRDELEQGYEELDARSKYQRFLSVVPHLTDAMLDRLVDGVDGVDHVALVIFVFDEPGVGEPGGVARMIRYADEPEVADVAVTILPRYRGRGAASALLRQLLVERPKGVRRLRTSVLGDNEASLRMLTRLGPSTVTSEGGNVLTVEVELPEPGTLEE